MQIQIKILNKEFYCTEKWGISYISRLPDYQTDGSAAMDLYCTKDLTLHSNDTKIIDTGIAIWIGSENNSSARADLGFAGMILPRSGLGTRGLVLANTVGLIDEDYQYELKISAWNRSKNSIEIREGDRIAQLMIVPIIRAKWRIVDDFNVNTDRDGGFGSSGR